MKRTQLRKVSKTTTSRIQKKCDALLTPIIIKRSPKCMLCPNKTQVAHHHVHKSKSNALRYDLDNLINLCNSCHFALHHNESFHASIIVKIKGLDWFSELERKKNMLTVKTNVGWYKENLERLENILSTGTQ